MRPAFLFGIIIFFSAGCVSAQPSQNETKEAEYIRTINSRAQKITATLNITDSTLFNRVQTIIANQYRHLNDLHTSRDEQVKAAKSSGEDKQLVDAKVKSIQDESAKKIALLHQNYIGQLSSQLSKDQVEKVKDGMTYNVVNITYSGYLDMLQNLTSEQKAQIMTWLIEAREQAMDAESSEKKHGWFGKYKGRINNYLSAAGYDLKKEGEAWQQRIKEREQKKNATK